MNRYVERSSQTIVWALALIMALVAGRYFYLSPQTVNDLEDKANAALGEAFHVQAPPPIHPFDHHPILLSIHVACGTAAIVLGLFQFLPGLRNNRPELHRRIGYFYIGAVAIGSVVGFPLSFLFFDPWPQELRARFLPVIVGFATLSVTWTIVTGIAFNHARSRRFEKHRAWMLRSYCLTYAAVTTRLVAPIFLLLTRDAVISSILALTSWPLNLVFAEWLIRRELRATISAKAAGAS